MSKNKISVTYEVTFAVDVQHGTKLYKADTAYVFKTKSPTSHPGDMFDEAYNAIHRLFGLIEKGIFLDFLPLKHDPKVITWKEATSWK